MAKLNISADDLCNLTNQLRSCSESLTDDIRRTNVLLNEINIAWSETELGRLIDEAQHSTSNCSQLIKALTTLTEYMESAYESYLQVEQNLIQSIEKFKLSDFI